MIVFLDDEPERISDYVEALNKEFPDQVKDHVDINETLELISNDNVDVIILDVMMPPGPLGMEKTQDGLRTGTVLYDEIRKMEQGAELPVLILTNVRDPETVIFFKKQKNCEVFSKPDLEPKGLAAQVREILSR